MASDEIEPDDDEELAEVEIGIEPREERLEALGITGEQFEAALNAAFDAFHELLDSTPDPDAVPPLDDLPIDLNGQTYRLSDVAEIHISGDIPDWDDDAE